MSLFDRFVKPFKKSVEPFVEPLIRKRSEEELIAAVNERIPVMEEPPTPEDADKAAKKEDEYERLVRRLEPQLEVLGITTEEMLRYYDKPLYAMVVLKFAERFKKKPSEIIRDRLIDLGFIYLQNNLWVLPPLKTPQELRAQEDVKAWVRQNVTKSLRKDHQFVMPFIAMVDLKKTVSERHRVVKQPMGRTVFSMMDRKEILPSSYIYSFMKRKGFSLEGLIRSGDVEFLARAFADPETLEGLRENKGQVTRQIQKLMNTDGISLSYIADLHERELASALKGAVPHPVEVAQRLGLEAQYWERFLEGDTSTPGPRKTPETQARRTAPTEKQG